MSQEQPQTRQFCKQKSLPRIESPRYVTATVVSDEDVLVGRLEICRGWGRRRKGGASVQKKVDSRVCWIHTTVTAVCATEFVGNECELTSFCFLDDSCWLFNLVTIVHHNFFVTTLGWFCDIFLLWVSKKPPRLAQADANDIELLHLN